MSVGIVVGVNEYPPRSGQTTLLGAVADAAAMAEWLLQPDGGGVAPSDLYFWAHPKPQPDVGSRLEAFLPNNPWTPDPPGERAPSRNDIWDLIIHLMEGNFVSDKRVYLYFAGHGVMGAPAVAGHAPPSYFVPADYRPGAGAAMNLVCLDHIIDGLRSRNAQVVLFSDTCRDALAVNVPVLPTFLPINPVAGAGDYLNGRATTPGKRALELTHSGSQRGAFTVQLIDGLNQRNAKGGLTVLDLDQYVTTGLSSAFSDGRSQTPDFTDCFPANYRFHLFSSVLEKRGAEPPIGGAVAFTNPEIVVEIATVRALPLRLVDHTLSIIANNLNAGSPWRAALPVGSYSLETADQSFSHAFNHTGPGETHVRL